ncbi:MAG: DUF11 domain-containing protein, partial [Chloroflexi bacterium]|nr:DUF11 domain-containing protein [Chloroflexota bacterium]
TGGSTNPCEVGGSTSGPFNGMIGISPGAADPTYADDLTSCDPIAGSLNNGGVAQRCFFGMNVAAGLVQAGAPAFMQYAIDATPEPAFSPVPPNAPIHVATTVTNIGGGPNDAGTFTISEASAIPGTIGPITVTQLVGVTGLIAADCGVVGEVVTCTLAAGDFDPTESVRVDFDYTVTGTPASPPDANFVVADVIPTNPDNAPQNDAVTILSVILSASKSDGFAGNAPTIAAGGGTATYVLSVTNGGTGTATGVVITDVIPNELNPPGNSNANFAKAGWAVNPTCSVAGQTITCSGGSLAGGGTGTITFTVTAKSNIVNGTVVCNSFTADSVQTDPAVNSNSECLTISSSAHLVFTKVASKSTVTSTPQEQFSWIYTVTNDGTAPLTNGTITDADVRGTPTTVVEVFPASQSIPNCTLTGNSLSCNMTSPLNAGASFNVQVGMRAAAGQATGASTSNNADTFTTETGTVQSSTGTVTINNNPILTISKSFSGGTVGFASSGGPTPVLTVTVTNVGAAPATGIVINDPAPAGLTFSSAGQSGGAVCTIVSNTLQGTVATLAAGASASCTANVNLTAGSNPASGACFLNTASATSAQQPAPITASASVCAALPNLTISKTSSGVTDPNTGNFTIVIGNNGNATATGVSLVDQISSQLTVPSTSTSVAGGATAFTAGNCNSGASLGAGPLISCTGGTVPVGGTITVIINVRPVSGVPDGTVVNNSATADSAEGGPVSASASITVRAGRLAISKTNSPGTMGVGDIATSTIVVSNTGGFAVTGVNVVDTLDTGTAFVSTGSSPGCTAAGQVVTCTVGTLNAGSSATVTIRFVANTLGNKTNTATTTNTSGVANPSASATVHVVTVGGRLVHVDLDNATEDAADDTPRDFDASHPSQVYPLTIQDDSDDATRSTHTACLVSADLGAADNSDIAWTITPAAPHQDITGFPVLNVQGDGTANDDAQANCMQWRVDEPVEQLITATYVPTGDKFYWDNATNAPLIKQWNSPTNTQLVGNAAGTGPAAGNVGDTLVASNQSGDLADWPNRECSALPVDAGFCTRPDMSGKTLDVTGVLIPSTFDKITAAGQSFIDYANGSHPNYSGPIDGMQQTYTVTGDCGSVRLEDPVTGSVIKLDPVVGGFNAAATVPSSDKGVGFEILPNNDAALTTTAANANCIDSTSITVTIKTEEYDPALSSRPKVVIIETITIHWRMVAQVSKPPQLAWAGQRVLLEKDWRNPAAAGGDCPYPNPFYVRYQGTLPIGAALNAIPGEAAAASGPDFIVVSVTPAKTALGNSDCISRVIVECEDPAEVDVTAHITDAGGAIILSPEMDFVVYCMKFEDVTLTIAATSSIVSTDQLVTVKVRGWVPALNCPQRPEAVDLNGHVKPANRCIFPDDWQTKFGNKAQFDLMGGTACSSKNAGPLSLLDGPACGDSKAPLAPLTGAQGRETIFPNGTVNADDAPMPSAEVKIALSATSSGFIKPFDKPSGDGQYQVTHIPPEPWILGGNYLWHSWGIGAKSGLYNFWDSLADNSAVVLSAPGAPGGTPKSTGGYSWITIYSDNHGVAKAKVNGDANLTWEGCDTNLPSTIQFVSGHYCNNGVKVGSSTLTATVDYPDKRKHEEMTSAPASIDWTWGGIKDVTIVPGKTNQFNYVVLHLTDRDGLCAGGDSDVGQALGAFAGDEKHSELGTANAKFDPDERVYRDADGTGAVSVGDTRLTTVSSTLPAGSIVKAGDSDIGDVLVAFKSNEKHTGPAAYTPGEGIYRDNDSSATVSNGDTRLTQVGGFAAGTTVSAGGPAAGLNGVLGETVKFSINSPEGEIVKDVNGNAAAKLGTWDSDSATVTTFSADSNATIALGGITQPKLVASGDECQAWIHVHESQLSPVNVRIEAQDPEGTVTFDVLVNAPPVVPPPAPIVVKLFAGWNFVSWQADKCANSVDAFEPLTDADALDVAWRHDNESKAWTSFDPDVPDIINDLKQVCLNDVLVIHVSEDIDWPQDP